MIEMMTRRLCSAKVDKSMTRAGRWARAGTGLLAVALVVAGCGDVSVAPRASADVRLNVA